MAIKHFKAVEFDAAVDAAPLAMVDFWASWCGPCRMLSPVVDEVSQAHQETLSVGKVNVDDCPDLAQKFGVMSIPTLLLFKGGELVDQRVGYMPKNELENMVQKAL